MNRYPYDPRPTELWSQKLGNLIAPAIPALWRPIQAAALSDRLIKDSLTALNAGNTLVRGRRLWE